MPTANPRKPNLFIVGPARSGTTALYEILKQHPDIYMSELKEPQYFSKDINQQRDEFYGRRIKKHFGNYEYRRNKIETEKRYLELFSNWKGEKIIGEASTDYLPSKVAALKIHKFNPEAKIIIIIRNPIDRLYSSYKHQMRVGFDANKTFREFVEENTPLRVIYEQVQNYLNIFGPRQVKVLVYDDFKKDNAGVCKEVFKFLGVDPNFKPDFGTPNESRIPRFGNIHSWLKFSLPLRLFLFPKYILPGKLSKVFGKIISPLLLSYKALFTIKQPVSSLDPELSKELMTRFKPEIERLSRVLNRDLISLWSYDNDKGDEHQ